MIRRILLICALGMFFTRALLVNYTISFLSVKLLFTRNSLTKDHDLRGVYPDRSAQCVPCARIELLWHQKCHRNRRNPRLLQQKLQQQRIRLHIASEMVKYSINSVRSGIAIIGENSLDASYFTNDLPSPLGLTIVPKASGRNVDK